GLSGRAPVGRDFQKDSQLAAAWRFAGPSSALSHCCCWYSCFDSRHPALSTPPSSAHSYRRRARTPVPPSTRDEWPAETGPPITYEGARLFVRGPSFAARQSYL